MMGKYSYINAEEHMRKSLPFALEDHVSYDNYGQRLLCPICRSDYNHHGKVEVFRRMSGKEDAPSMVMDYNLMTWQATDNNPSGRRGAVRIHFEGECGHQWYLDIIQHKGQTFLVAGSES